MYVYEAPRLKNRHVGELHIVGSDAEREGYARFIGGCLVWATRMQEVSFEKAASLHKRLQTEAPIGTRDRVAMIRVLDVARLYGLTDAYGMYVSAIDESVEAEVLLDKTHARSCLIDFVLADGILAEESDGWLDPYVLPLDKLADHYDEDTVEMRAAHQAGYDSFGWQAEIVHRPGEAQPYKALSDRQHLSLGMLMPDGRFEPMLTVLDETHPVRQGSAVQL